MKKLKQLCAGILAIGMVWTLSACGDTAAKEQSDGKIHVVATIFPAYDFARAVCGDAADVELLLPPGAESHSYEPTPQDILDVQNCGLFVCLGGESEAWVETILDSLDSSVETLKMTDCVKLLNEETMEGMTSHEDSGEHKAGEVVEIDEHVWTAPANAAKITLAIGEKMAELDSANAEVYRANAKQYAAQIGELDGEFQTFFSSVSNKTLIFGDRFPLRYFAEEYGLTCYAAFPGCSTQTEPSAATIAFLTDKVRQEDISTVYYIEFSNHLVADSIAEATGAGTALFHTCHNVSQADLDAGATYVSLMRTNLETLRQTMQ